MSDGAFKLYFRTVLMDVAGVAISLQAVRLQSARCGTLCFYKQEPEDELDALPVSDNSGMQCWLCDGATQQVQPANNTHFGYITHL